MGLTIEHAEGYRALLRLRRDPASLMGSLGRRSVDLFRLRVAGREIVVVNQPRLIQDILVTHDWNFVKGRGLRASRPMLGHGLLTSEGELHRRERRLAQPAFHSARLAGYADEMVRAAHELARQWRHGATLTLNEEMMRLTLRIVGLTLFGADITREAATVGDALSRSLGNFQQLNSPLVQAIPPLQRLYQRRAREARQKIAGVLQGIIDAHRREPARYDDMLSMLMRSRQESGVDPLSDELLLDECLTLFLAGHETTANALTWTWYLLARNPECESRLHAELDEVLADRLPTMEDMARLPYTTAVVRESLRLFPPAWVMAREAVTPYRLDELEVDAGANLLMSPFATQRDPRFWPAAESFQPERWLHSVDPAQDAEASPRPRFAYFPFGAGTRVCIGEHFALMEAVLVLATLARRFRLRMVAGQQVRLLPQITLRPRDPMLVALEQRHRPA